MLQSFLVQEEAVDSTIRKLRLETQLSIQDWDKMRQVVKVLKPFDDATQMLSSHDASISMAIPIVTTIMMSLNPTNEDHGVKGMMRSLQQNMEKPNRFGIIESNEHYTVATLLDAHFKGFFFRKPDTLDRAKEVVISEIVKLLRVDGTASQVCYLNNLIPTLSNPFGSAGLKIL